MGLIIIHIKTAFMLTVICSETEIFSCYHLVFNRNYGVYQSIEYRFEGIRDILNFTTGIGGNRALFCWQDTEKLKSGLTCEPDQKQKLQPHQSSKD